MANKASLKPFTKGDPRAVEAGKKGKRGPSIVTALKKMLMEDKKMTPEAIAKAIGEYTLAGSAPHAKILVEYIDGKVPDKMQITGADGGPIETRLLSKDEYKKTREKMIKEDDC